MRRFILGGLAALALALAGAISAAAAQDVPALRPTRDVAVVYRVVGSPPPSGLQGGAEQAHTIRMIWGDQGQELRVEVDRQSTVALIDFKRQRATMLIEPQRLALDFTLDPRLIPGFVIPADATVTRAGTDTVAGQTCEVWKLTGPRGTGEACITRDGLVLRAEGSLADAGTGRLQAVSVAYGPQPALLFAPPPDFRRMDLQTAGR
jgi:hypothetical protein